MNKDAEGRWKVGMPKSNWECGRKLFIAAIVYWNTSYLDRFQRLMEHGVKQAAAGVVTNGEARF